MISKIRLLLDYDTYCLWLYDENEEIVANDNPPEWNDDKELTDAFMAVSDYYDSLFINDKNEFRFMGYPDENAKEKLSFLISNAVDILLAKNNGKYIIQNDIQIT